MVGILDSGRRKGNWSIQKTVIERIEEQQMQSPTMITIGNEVNYNFLNMSSGDGWEGFVAMSKISKMIREEGIKPAVSVSAPTTDASDIQWIIGKLGNADVDYDYIGVNIYPDTHNENYVKNIKEYSRRKGSRKADDHFQCQMSMERFRRKSQYNDTDKEHL